jgi:ATP-dependent RNA helicase DHX8/PRP22
LQLQRDEFEQTINTYTDKLTDNNIRLMFERECERFKEGLPIYGMKTTILNTLASNQVCIVQGDSGSGKSTQLVQYAYEAACLGISKISRRGQIVCTQPRKIAAITLARHVARQFGSQVGDVVGYRVGGEVKENANTAIKYVTDRILLNECIADNTLSKYSCIIVDEAHERTLFTDLLLSLLKEVLTRRPDLRLIITSSTIDTEVLQKYFCNCPLIEVPRRAASSNVGLHYEPKPIGEQAESQYVSVAVERAWQQVQAADDGGGILVFLASIADVESACDQLMKHQQKHNEKQNVYCLPLHGGVEISEIEKVFEPAPPGKRKVVFATSVAESSLTIPDITCVIDSGWVKDIQYDTKMNMNRVQQHMISQRSAEQRIARIKRSEQGTCFRLYTEKQFAEMKDVAQPEILCTHLGLAILKFLEMGISNPHTFAFIESPPKEALDNAMSTLTELGAVENNKLTDLGQKLAKLELEPRYGKFC